MRKNKWSGDPARTIKVPSSNLVVAAQVEFENKN